MDTNAQNKRSGLRSFIAERWPLVTTARHILLEAKVMELEQILNEVEIVFDSIPVREMQLGQTWIPSNELLVLLSLAKDRLQSHREHR